MKTRFIFCLSAAALLTACASISRDYQGIGEQKYPAVKKTTILDELSPNGSISYHRTTTDKTLIRAGYKRIGVLCLGCDHEVDTTGRKLEEAESACKDEQIKMIEAEACRRGAAVALINSFHSYGSSKEITEIIKRGGVEINRIVKIDIRYITVVTFYAGPPEVGKDVIKSLDWPSFSLSHDGRRIAQNKAGVVSVWEVETGKLLARRADPDRLAKYGRCAFTPDGKLLVFLDKQWRPHVWDYGCDAVVKRLEMADEEERYEYQTITTFTLSPDGKYLLLYTERNVAFLLDMGTGRLVEGIVFRAEPYGFSPDGRYLAVAGEMFVDNRSVWTLDVLKAGTWDIVRRIQLPLKPIY